MRPPTYDIDPQRFWRDPYPDLEVMQRTAPIAWVPQLGSILLTRRDHITACEKRIDVFSSDQPDGLMTKLMGQNMMRKDGEAHLSERKATFPAFSPRTVRQVWTQRFQDDAQRILTDLRPLGAADLVADFAMPLSGHALRAITGLEALTPGEMDRASQAMIDGIANYAGDASVEAGCRAATRMLDAAVDARAEDLRGAPDTSLISSQLEAGLPLQAIRDNVKLAISGGQNEPRDAIAGCVWALLTHPEQRALVAEGTVTWDQVFDEYVRWVSPIGMSPRRIAAPLDFESISFEPGDRVFLMYGAANRDPDHFEDADRFDITRQDAKHIAFGAGPHFCAGAAASRALIAGVALPMLFNALPTLRLDGPCECVGWAFRGLQTLPVRWTD